MMKRICSFVLALTLAVMTACSESSQSNTASREPQQTESSQQTSKAESAVTTEAQSSEPDNTSSQAKNAVYFPAVIDTDWKTLADEPYNRDRWLYTEHTRQLILENYDTLDTDDDGLPDAYEKQIQTDPEKKDTDGDGLTDGEEIFYTQTNPLKEKTIGYREENDAQCDDDKDGLTDRQELDAGTASYLADSDEDGLSDGDELNKYKTDPKKKDTDGDGIFDGDELAFGTDPLNIQTNGKNDTERFTSCKVYPYDPALDGMNRANENYYTVSLIYDAFDGTPQLTGTSRNRSVIKNYPDTTVLGKGVAFIQPKGAMLKNGIVFFKVDENFIRDKLAGRQANDIKGIYRLKVYGVNREWGDYVPLETKYDPDTNIVYARTQQYTEFELINYKNDNDFLT
ncbi:MAG: thrombospondin type 3 repeat-containing protein [Ruminococcus sp.]|nr:thrombospondin type 3 repeat-containing protein [Ruminococcus sp.]